MKSGRNDAACSRATHDCPPYPVVQWINQHVNQVTMEHSAVGR
jgi:hypothetical protein